MLLDHPGRLRPESLPVLGEILQDSQLLDVALVLSLFLPAAPGLVVREPRAGWD